MLRDWALTDSRSSTSSAALWGGKRAAVLATTRSSRVGTWLLALPSFRASHWPCTLSWLHLGFRVLGFRV